jgi:succinate dehydrogenase/fumarate reductase cytochrome b subunit
MKKLQQVFLILSMLAAVVLIAGVVMQNEWVYKTAALVTAIFLAIGLGAVTALKVYHTRRGLHQQLLQV